MKLFVSILGPGRQYMEENDKFKCLFTDTRMLVALKNVSVGTGSGEWNK